MAEDIRNTAMTEKTSDLEQDRRQLADTVTAAVKKMAEVIEKEQAELRRRFPAMAHQSAPVMLDPTTIRDFTQSEAYKRAIESYVAGRLEVNLLVKVLDLLRTVAPVEFLR